MKLDTIQPTGRITGTPFCSFDCCAKRPIYTFDVAADDKGQCPPTRHACGEPLHLLTIMERVLAHGRDVRVITSSGLERVIARLGR